MTIFTFQKQAVEKFKKIEVFSVYCEGLTFCEPKIRFPTTLTDLSLIFVNCDLSSLPQLTLLKKLALLDETLLEPLVANIVDGCQQLQYIALMRTLFRF